MGDAPALAGQSPAPSVDTRLHMVQHNPSQQVPQAAITISTHIDQDDSRPVPPRQPRARGGGVVTVAADEAGKTRLKSLRQSGATKLVFPHQTTGAIEAILINTAGGVTGGDRFDLTATLEDGASLTLTTQAAERAYRAQTGEVGQIVTQATLADGAELNWLPQELILFDGSALHRRLNIDVAAEARLLLVEPVVFGRAAMGERLNAITFKDRITIRRQGLPLYLDAVNLSGDVTAQLARTATAHGAAAMANVVVVRPDAVRLLPKLRAALPATAGASLIAEDTLVLRLMAQDGFLLRRSLIPLLEHLLNRNLPTSWRL